MSIARTAVLALAVLSVTAGRPASAQTFQERWSPIPRADAAEKPLLDQDQTLLGRSQQQVRIPPDRSHSHSRMAQQQPPAPVTQQRAHPRAVRAITFLLGAAGLCSGLLLITLDRTLSPARGIRSAMGIVAFAAVMLAGNHAWSNGLFDENVRAQMLKQRDGQIAHIETEYNNLFIEKHGSLLGLS